MGGVDICPLLILGFGQWNLRGCVSALISNRSFKKPRTFPPFLWRTCSLLRELHVPNGGCSFNLSHSTRRQMEKIQVCLCLATQLPAQRLELRDQPDLRWHRWARVTHPCYWTSDVLGLFVMRHCFRHPARAEISNQPRGSGATSFSSCHVLFLLIPLLIVWIVLSTPL